MGFGNKFKNMFNMSEEEYYDDVDIDEEEDNDDYVRESKSNFGFGRSKQESENKVVDIRSTAPSGASKAHVVFKKLDRYEDVGSVADELNDKKIVILNLETCPNDVSVRIIDFLSGVAYANNGEMKRVAGRAYIITPYNVPLTGELLDGFTSSSY